MSREASDLTKAIRSLCDETGGSITFSQAQPRLKSMGFDVAVKPQKSDEYRKWEDHSKSHPFPKSDAPESDFSNYYKATVKNAGLPARLVEQIATEDAQHRAFENEQNSFNVAKHQWRKMASGATSHKPTGSKNAKAKAAAKARNAKTASKRQPAVADKPTPANFNNVKLPPKAQKAASSNIDEVFAAAKYVLENGGYETLQKKLVELQNEAAHLADVLSKAASLGKMLPNAA